MSTYDDTVRFTAHYDQAVQGARDAGLAEIEIYDRLRSAQYSALLEHVARLSLQASGLADAAETKEQHEEYRRQIETRIDNRALEIAVGALEAAAQQRSEATP